MTLDEKITQLEKNLEELSKPPVEIEDTHVDIATETCEKHGQYECRTRTYPNSLIKITPRSSICPGCLSDELIRLQGEKIRNDEAARKRNIDLLLDGLNIPARFENCTLQNYEPVNDDAKRALKVCQAYASRWPERLQKGGGLVMCGKPGTGKNHLALAIARHAITEHQSSAVFTTALKIAREYKSTWSKGSSRTEDDVIRYFTKPDLLIIDEVGVQFGSDAEKLIMFEIINTRYERMKPTILISNQTREELAAFIGERVLDRMSDGGGCTLSFTWDSYRSKGAA
ncbi:TPA: ATP-binding protein [Citrobacter freundii]|uniref:ATP-binding protein n=1 Tax=Citrobacter freundii TaxID=546 RepID=UPI0029D7F53C|nr:ATP-binding protein [Citrobacter freundii]MDX6980343.1 ATP-binding protein [Citrobacter freundii]HBZ9568578.1 ATP-binding protein [Citrobacter freundii]HCA1224789.1 ATP-binding protein [Citrobacter freundii]HCA1613078.1 ATP-binding protein [Citrobacter freundii]HCA1842575.1 ATP-binding protein [Citrobacter freundii]